MDRFAGKQFEKQTIYEIFRACRLCGAGGGFKMPIIQNVVDLDDTDVELKQKIRDCVQIEVHPDDKMPPLICELCIDKINDFYEFLEMCRQTNTRTRQRLGLPKQKALGAPEEGDCILGVTEALNVQDSEDEPLSKEPSKKTNKSTKGKKVPPLIVKKANIKTEAAPEKTTIILSAKNLKDIKSKVKRGPSPSPKTRRREPSPPLKTRRREPSPPPKTRRREPSPPPKTRKREPSPPPRTRKREPTPPLKTRRREPSPKTRRREPSPPPKRVLRKLEEDKEKDKSVKSDRSSRRSSLEQKPAPKSILKPVVKISPVPKIDDPHELLVPRRKRPLETTPKGPPAKKVKITPPPPPPPPKPRPPSPKVIPCNICESEFKSGQGLANHMRSHVPTFTNPKLACNACGEWFLTPEEISSHHKDHSETAYRCRNCFSSFDTYTEFNEHFEKDPCELYEEIPDYKCDECWHEFVTQYLYLQHQCQGVDGRKGGKCKKCSKPYALNKNLVKHEEQCTYRKKGTVYIEPEIERILRVLEIRVAKCDPLLKKNVFDRYNVALVPSTYGLDPKMKYPYRRIKPELNNSMVKIHYDSFDYIHWDSDYTANDSDSSDSSKNRKIDSLSTLALKVIFSKRCLGRIPKKRRKALKKDAFDAIMKTDSDKGIKKDIASIIADLDKAWEEDENDELSNENDTGSVSLLDVGLGGKSDAHDSMTVSKDAINEDDATKVSSNEEKVTDTDVSNNNGEAMDVSESEQGKLSDSLENKNVEDVIGKDTNDITENEVKEDIAESQTFTQDCTQDETSNSRLSPTFTQKVDDDVATPNNGKCDDENKNNDDKIKNGDVCKDEKLNTKDVQNCENDKQNETSDVKASEDNLNTNSLQANGVAKENKKFNEPEAYDKELMAALDEQIVANHNDTKKLSEVEEKKDNDKPNCNKSMELDNISDGEIDFDL